MYFLEKYHSVEFFEQHVYKISSQESNWKIKSSKKMSNQTLGELVKIADKITIDEIKGKKVMLKISWFDLKGVRKSKKFLLTEKDKIEF